MWFAAFFYTIGSVPLCNLERPQPFLHVGGFTYLNPILSKAWIGENVNVA